MNTRTDKIWLFGGILAIVLIAFGGWTLLISPERSARDEVTSSTADQQLQLISLKKEVVKLKAESAKLATYKATQATLLQALPTQTEMTNFLRQAQASGTAMNVAVTNLNVAQAAKSTTSGVSGTIWELPITATVTGSATDLSRFLVQLQNVQSRAILITAVTLTGTSTTSSTDGTSTTGADDAEYTASLTLKAFVQPAAGTTTLTKN